jgi:hypothetical protein
MISNNLGARISAAKESVSIADAWTRLGLPDPPPEGNRLVRSPIREERTPSFSIFQGGRRWKDHGDRTSGDLLDFVQAATGEDGPAAIQRVLEWAGDVAPLSGHGATSSSPPPQSPTSPGKTRIISDERARDIRRFERSLWPEFHDPTQADIEQIARVRKLDACAVHAIASAGLLKVAKHNWERVFVIREKLFAQWRPLSGELFAGKHKALNFKGSEGAFVGACLLGTDKQPALLIEGCVGLLEAAALIGGAKNGWAWTAVAATSSDSKFSAAPDLLAKLAGRRVRIIPDQDESGAKGAASWCDDLHAAGASVDFFDLPAGHHDLGTIARSPSNHAELIHRLFTF